MESQRGPHEVLDFSGIPKRAPRCVGLETDFLISLYIPVSQDLIVMACLRSAMARTMSGKQSGAFACKNGLISRAEVKIWAIIDRFSFTENYATSSCSMFSFLEA